MRSYWLWGLLICGFHAHAQEADFWPMGNGLLKSRLGNGLTVVLVPDSTSALVSFSYISRGGNSAQVPGLEAAPALYKTLLAGPNGRLRQNDAGRFSEAFGARWDVELAPNHLEVSLRGLNATWTQLPGELLRAVAPPPTDTLAFVQARIALNRVLEAAGQSPAEYLVAEHQDRLWGAAAARKKKLPSYAAIRAATVEDLVRYHRTFCVPAKSVLVVQGNLKPRQLVAVLDTTWYAWRPPDPAALQPLPYPPVTKDVGFTLASSQMLVPTTVLGWQLPPADGPRAYSLGALTAALLQLQTGPLRTRLEETGLADDISTAYHPGPLRSQLNIGVVARSRTGEAVEALWRALDTLAKPGFIQASQLEIARLKIRQHHLQALETRVTQAGIWAEFWAGPGLETAAHLERFLREVSAEDVRRFIAEQLVGQPMVQGTMLPESYLENTRLVAFLQHPDRTPPPPKAAPSPPGRAEVLSSTVGEVDSAQLARELGIVAAYTKAWLADSTARARDTLPPPDDFVWPPVQPLSDSAFRARLDSLTIYFGYNKRALDSAEKARLPQVGELLNNRLDLVVSVEGHSDSKGSAENNLLLSKKRAEFVRDFLVDSLGIPCFRLHVVPYGETRPAVPEKMPEDRAKNRRVSFGIYDPEQDKLPATAKEVGGSTTGAQQINQPNE